MTQLTGLRMMSARPDQGRWPSELAGRMAAALPYCRLLLRPLDVEHSCARDGLEDEASDEECEWVGEREGREDGEGPSWRRMGDW